MDRLTKYDYKVHHRPCTANIMRIADGMSRIPGRYSQNAVVVGLERMVSATSHPAEWGDGPETTPPENKHLLLKHFQTNLFTSSKLQLLTPQRLSLGAFSQVSQTITLISLNLNSRVSSITFGRDKNVKSLILTSLILRS